jgi:hypothetical protein
MGQGNSAIHDRQRQRYRCKICKPTKAAGKAQSSKSRASQLPLIMIVETFLSYGCLPAVVDHSIKLMGDTAYSVLELGLHARAQQVIFVTIGLLDVVLQQQLRASQQGRINEESVLIDADQPTV